MANRSGKRKTRDQSLKSRIPELGHYLIVTDTNETERNYMNGLRDSIPIELQHKIVLKVRKAKAKGIELVNETINIASLQPQYSETWIIFDRDQVKGFDQIVSYAKKNDIRVGWSNPCIEIWFNAYFGEMPAYLNSVVCCNGFKSKYLQVAKQNYEKSDNAIYSKLNRYGNEKKAIEIASLKYLEHEFLPRANNYLYFLDNRLQYPRQLN